MPALFLPPPLFQSLTLEQRHHPGLRHADDLDGALRARHSLGVASQEWGKHA